MALTPAEIGNFGERHATAALQAAGRQCYRNTQQPGSTDIEARGQNKMILDRARAKCHPRTAVGRAPQHYRACIGPGYEALEQFQINGQGELVLSIDWSKLN
jgi:hypothetical protein